MLDDDRASSVARALGHPARFRIMRLLAAQSECRGADVFGELPLAQSTISEHLRVLKDAGLVTSRSEGVATAYCIVPSALEELSVAIAEMVGSAPTCAGGSRDGCIGVATDQIHKELS